MPKPDPEACRTNDALAAMSLIRLAKLLRMPYPYGEVRSATVRWFVECYTVLALIAVVLTSGWIGYDIGQRTMKAPVTAKTPKEEILLPLP